MIFNNREVLWNRLNPARRVDPQFRPTTSFEMPTTIRKTALLHSQTQSRVPAEKIDAVTRDLLAMQNCRDVGPHWIRHRGPEDQECLFPVAYRPSALGSVMCPSSGEPPALGRNIVQSNNHRGRIRAVNGFALQPIAAQLSRVSFIMTTVLNPTRFHLHHWSVSIFTPSREKAKQSIICFFGGSLPVYVSADRSQGRSCLV